MTTTVAGMITALRAEVAARIVDIVPNIKATRRFKQYSDEARRTTPFEEFTGKVRTFELGAVKFVEHFGVGQGGSVAHKKYEMPITFLYRNTQRYQDAASDDMDVISRDLLNTSNSHGITGVGNRRIDMDIDVIREPVTDDPWDRYTLRLLMWLDINA